MKASQGYPILTSTQKSLAASGKIARIARFFFYHFAVLHIRQNPQPASRGFCNKKEERKMKKIKIKSDLSLVYPEDVKKERG